MILKGKDDNIRREKVRREEVKKYDHEYDGFMMIIHI